MLAGATGRRGATSGGPTWGSSWSTTDDAHPPDGFVDDDDTTTDGANQSTPVGAHHSRNRERRRPSLVDTHPDGAHHVAHHVAEDVSESTARRHESEYGAGARSGATVGEPSPTDAGSGRNRRHLRRGSYSSTEDSSPEMRRRHRIRPRNFLMVQVRSSRSGHSSRIAQPTTDGTMWTSWRI